MYPLTERRPVGIALHDGLHDLRQLHPGQLYRCADLIERTGRAELLVAGIELGDAAGE